MDFHGIERETPAVDDQKKSIPKPTEIVGVALQDLFDLLEEYAPVWYTEEHHNRAIAALKTLKKC